jgi:hypothetical protein
LAILPYRQPFVNPPTSAPEGVTLFASLCVECKASEEREPQKLAEKEHAEMEALAPVLDMKDGEEEEVTREMLRAARFA